MAGFIINRQLPILLYIVLSVLTHLFGVPVVGKHAVDAIPYPAPKELFTEKPHNGVYSGRQHFFYDTHSFIPFIIFVEYGWEVQAKEKDKQATGFSVIVAGAMHVTSGFRV
jgi:hypothetical protein